MINQILSFVLHLRKQLSYECVANTYATAIEFEHYLRNEEKDSGVYFSPALVRRLDDDLREALRLKEGQGVDFWRAGNALAKAGYFKKVKLADKHDAPPIMIIRQNYEGDRVKNGKWYIPPGAAKLNSTHALVSYGNDDEKNMFMTDSGNGKAYILPVEYQFCVLQCWKIIL